MRRETKLFFRTWKPGSTKILSHLKHHIVKIFVLFNTTIFQLRNIRTNKQRCLIDKIYKYSPQKAVERINIKSHLFGKRMGSKQIEGVNSSM